MILTNSSFTFSTAGVHKALTLCSQCGHEDHIFGHDGAKIEAEKRGIPFLGAIPLSRDIRENADSGKLVPDVDLFNKLVACLH